MIMKDFELGSGDFILKLKPKENKVIIEYNPSKILRPYKRSIDDEQHYEEDLEFIKRRIDWSIRKSDGQNPDISEFPKLPSN